MTIDPFDQLMASLDPPMVIVTAQVDGERSGCLVGFHCQSSIDPRGYSVWISKANHTYALAMRATHLAVHLLAEGDRELARTFGTLTGDDVDKFSLVSWREGRHGVPILEASEHGLVGRKVSVLDDQMDHVVIGLDPVESWNSGPFTPLRLSQADDLVPGHDAEDHPADA